MEFLIGCNRCCTEQLNSMREIILFGRFSFYSGKKMITAWLIMFVYSTNLCELTVASHCLAFVNLLVSICLFNYGLQLEREDRPQNTKSGRSECFRKIFLGQGSWFELFQVQKPIFYQNLPKSHLPARKFLNHAIADFTRSTFNAQSKISEFKPTTSEKTKVKVGQIGQWRRT